MNWLLLCLGIVITLAGMIDMLSATLGLGGGFIGRRLIRLLWWPAVWLNEKLGGGARLLRPWGMGLNLITLLVWVVMIIVGWLLIFSASQWAVVSQATELPTDLIGRLQFTVSTLSGLGRGLSRPGEIPGWQLTTLVASLGGTFVISFAISFLIPVIQAATAKRALAHRISLLGESPIQILEIYCQDGTSDMLRGELRGLLEDFVSVYEQHRTYPTLHLLFSSHRFDNMALNLVILDEAITLLRSAFPELYSSRPEVFEPLRTTLTKMLNDLDSIYIEHHPNEMRADVPTVEELGQRVACDVDEESFRQSFEDDDLKARRRKLGTLLRNNGWTWDDVFSEENTKKQHEAEEQAIESEKTDESARANR